MKNIILFIFLILTCKGFSQNNVNLLLYAKGPSLKFPASGSSDIEGCGHVEGPDSWAWKKDGFTVIQPFYRGRYLISSSTNLDLTSILGLSGKANDYTTEFEITPNQVIEFSLQENYVVYKYEGKAIKVVHGFSYEIKRHKEYPELCQNIESEKTTTLVKTYSVKIEEQPALKSKDPITVCRNKPSINLFDFVTQPEGFFVLNGVAYEGENFKPSSLSPGAYLFEYRKIYSNGETVLPVVIQIIDEPLISSNDVGTVCNNDTEFNLSSKFQPNPSGGIWKLNGTTLTTFNPSEYNGLQLLNYEVSDKGCVASKIISLNVIAPEKIEIVPIDPICINSSNVALQVSPAAWRSSSSGMVRVGKWTTENIGAIKSSSISNVLDSVKLKNLSIGDNLLSYDYLSEQGCLSKGSITIKVFDTTKVSFNTTNAVCITGSNVDLNIATSEQGGTWTGKGIDQNEFNPVTAGVGKHKLLYTYTNNQNCVSKNLLQVEVLKAVTESEFLGNFDPGTICNNSDAVDLNALVVPFPAGGIWEGQGIGGNKFSPSLFSPGAEVILTYKFTSSNGCTGSKSKTVKILEGPKLSPLAPVTLCRNAKAIALEANPYPWRQVKSASDVTYENAGTFEGDGVVPSLFRARNKTLMLNGRIVRDTTGLKLALLDSLNPLTSKSGELVYTYTGEGGCQSSTVKQVTILDTTPVAINGEAAYCIGDPTIDLSKLVDKKGGIFSGVKGITGNKLNSILTGTGESTIVYSYKDPSTGCVSKKYIPLIIKETPVITGLFEDAIICKNAESIDLYYEVSPDPYQGNFSGGAGVRGGKFVPSQSIKDTNVITYTYTDPITTCSVAKDKRFIVKRPDLVQLPQSIEECLNTKSIPLSVNPSQWSKEATGTVRRGVWTGARIKLAQTASSIDSIIPGKLEQGEYEYVYTYTNNFNCITKDTVLLILNDTTTISIGRDTAICQNNPPINLHLLQNIVGGQYSYKGRFINVFDASTANIGNNIVKYTYVNNDGCKTTLTKNFLIKANPVITGAVDTTIVVCRYSGKYPLTNVAFKPKGGIYSGFFVEEDKFFNATKAPQTSMVKYTADILGCKSEAEFTVNVQNTAELKTISDLLVCNNGAKIELTTSPIVNLKDERTGKWSGAGVILGKGEEQDSLNPKNLKPGVDSLKYTFVDEYGCKAQAGIKLTVAAAPTATIRASKIYVKVGEEIQFLPNAKNAAKYKWEFGDGDVSYEDNPWHYYYLPSDTLTVKLRAISQEGCEASFKTTRGQFKITGEKYQEVTESFDNTVWQTSSGSYIIIYPQLFSNEINGKFFLAKPENFTLELIDFTGKIIQSEEYVFASGLSKTTLNTEKLLEGIYFLKIGAKGNSKTFKLIKQ